jgi:hypothetical protein
LIIAAVGKNTLGDKMKILSQKYNLSAVYTNHSLRSTTLTMLDNEGFEARPYRATRRRQVLEATVAQMILRGEKLQKASVTKSSVLVGTMYMNFY